MFRLYDNFSTHCDNKMPYSIFVERHTEIENLHAGDVEGEFALKSIGNRFVLKTPELKNFRFKTHFGFTSMAEFKTNLSLLFQYDKVNRSGKAVKIEYNLENSFEVSLISVDRSTEVVLDSTIINDIHLEEGDRIELSVTCKGDKIEGSLDDKCFSFATEAKPGYLALERGNYIGMCLLSDIEVESDDDLNRETLLKDMTVEVPILNGGDIPYKLTFNIYKENEECYAGVVLSGGTSTREKNPQDRPGQYVAEIDTITAPYVKFKNGSYEEKFYIFNDSKLITDPNIFWQVLNEIWEVPDMPMSRTFPISEKLFSKDIIITYGYELFSAGGYTPNGGAGEFIYNFKGELLYQGEPLCGNVFELLSPKDKKIISYIPKDAYRYDEIVKHLETNHYFEVCEDISLTIRVRTKLNPEYISFKAQILDVYERDVIEEYSPEANIEDKLFDFNTVTATITHKPLPEKLYRAKFIFCYGDSEIEEFTRTFEVYDPNTDITPAVASGLPVAFSMPNEQKWLERSAFDLWNPMPSLDSEHYISIITDTPIEAERRRVWEVIKPFKRKWFAWLQNRTCRNYQPEDHPETVKYSDYLYYAPEEVFPMRNDFQRLLAYTNSIELRSILNDFLNLHPEIKEKVRFTVPTEDGEIRLTGFFEEEIDDKCWIDNERLKEFLDLCHEEWFEYAIERLHQGILTQNERLTAYNPNFKRAIYGPFNQYINCTLSYHTIRSFGLYNDERLVNDVYTGFAIFEDYPRSCSYQTYRGAFAVMTLNLHLPNLLVYPEQYQGSKRGGCIDGAVKFSNAPMGQYLCDDNFIATQSYEYIFNTPCLTDEGFSYWHNYGFHRSNFHSRRWNVLNKGWSNVIDYKPQKPYKAPAYLVQYNDREDEFDNDTKSLVNHMTINNRSEQAHGVLYECQREAGLNAGYGVKWDNLKNIKADECDFLVLPDLREAPKGAIEEIRRLYNEGVGLIGVSYIDGLEDIFGVKPECQIKRVNTITIGGESENIYPMDAEFLYKAEDAEAVLYSNCDIPVVYKKDRAILINAPVYAIGYECFAGTAAKGRKNISSLFRKVMADLMVDISDTVVLGENVGVTLFETEKGETVLLAMDYTPFDNREHPERMATVKLNLDGITKAESDRDIISVHNKEGKLIELSFKIKNHESVFVKLS